MAVCNDEFDVELECPIFHIEEDGFEEYPVLTNPPKSEIASCASNTEPGSELTSDEINGVTGNQNGFTATDLDLCKMDPQMDDGCDDIFTQIDENDIQNSHSDTENAAKTYGWTKKAYRSLDNSPLKRSVASEENMSFFASQNQSNGEVPPKRRFPGPAGILPKLRREELKFINMTPHPLYEKVSKIVSVNSGEKSTLRKPGSAVKRKKEGNETFLSKAPWKTLVKTLNLNLKDEHDLLNVLNISWIRTKVKKFSQNITIPFLAAVVQGQLEVTSSKNKFRHKNPSVRLMDPSGTIVAAFNPNFVDAYAERIVPGTAIALRNCGVLRLKKSLILKVAKKNLLCMASQTSTNEEDQGNQEEGDNTKISKQSTLVNLPLDNDIVVLQTQPLDPDKIMDEYQELVATMKDDIPQQHTEMPGSTALFSVIGSNAEVFKPFNPPFKALEDSNLAVAAYRTDFLHNQRSSAIENFSTNTSSGFDDDDDEELLQALENIDFVIDEDSM